MAGIIKPELEEIVKELGGIFIASGDFDESLLTLRLFGIENPISSRDLVYGRVMSGSDSSLNQASFTKEGFLYKKNEPVLLALESPLLNLELLKDIEKDVHRLPGVIAADNLIYESYREIANSEKQKDPQERKVFILSKKESYTINTIKFGKDELTLFLFKDMAKKYGYFLMAYGISNLPIWLIRDRDFDKTDSDKTFLTQLRLCTTDYGSDIAGCGRKRRYGSFRGLLKEDQVLKEYEKGYLEKQIERMYKIVSRIKKGKLPNTELEKVLEYLKLLKKTI